jgi:hypothetical protein
MVRRLLVRGMLVGLLAGGLAFAVAHTLGEPQVNRAIDFESYVEHDVHHDAPEAELVSRSLQSSAGLGTGTLLTGVAFGGVFALGFALTYGRVERLSARGTALLLGALGLLSISIVPILKYPANPPSIGNADTIGRRTSLYLIMILLSVLATVLAYGARRPLMARFGAWNGTLIAALGYLVMIAACYILMPGVNEVPQQGLHGVVHAVTSDGVTFPPIVLWRFRVASLAIQVTLWSTLALGFGAAAQRLLDNGQGRRRGRHRDASSEAAKADSTA